MGRGMNGESGYAVVWIRCRQTLSVLAGKPPVARGWLREKNMLRTTIPAAAFIVVVLTGKGIAQESTPEGDVAIPEMYAALAEVLVQVDTIEYEADLLLTDYIAEQGIRPGLTKQRHGFASSGERFYTSIKTVQTMIPPGIERQALFDGTELRLLNEGRPQVIKSPSAQQMRHYQRSTLLTAPFSFAFQDGDIVEHATLLDAKIWTRLADQSQHAGTETVEGATCEVVKILQMKEGSKFEYVVYFDPALHYYPRKWTCNIEVINRAEDAIDKRMRGEILVVPVVHEIGGKRPIVPASVKSDLYDVQERLFRTTEIQVDAETLKINQPIPDERFRLELP